MVVGFPYYLDGSPRPFNAGDAPGKLVLAGNRAWNVSSCPAGVTCEDSVPAGVTLARFDAGRWGRGPVTGAATGAPCAAGTPATGRSRP